MQWNLNSISEMRAFASNQAEKSKPGDVFLLKGDLGSGKSTFVKYFVESLGLEYQGSPTFGYINYYQEPKIVHADLYNGGNLLVEELQENSEDRILLIEWPSRNEMIEKIFANKISINFYFDGITRFAERLEPEAETRAGELPRIDV